MASYYDAGEEIARMNAEREGNIANTMGAVGNALLPTAGERMQRTQILANAIAEKVRAADERRKIAYGDQMKSLIMAPENVQAAGAQFFGSTPKEQALATRAVPFLNPERATPTPEGGSVLDLTGKHVTAGAAEAAGPAETVLNWLRPPNPNKALEVAQWKAAHPSAGADMAKMPNPFTVLSGYGASVTQRMKGMTAEQLQGLDARHAGELRAASFFGTYPQLYPEWADEGHFAQEMDAAPTTAAAAQYIENVWKDKDFQANASPKFRAFVRATRANIQNPKFWQFWKSLPEYQPPVQ